jgi:Kef-type K+ transport system membrane component KefB
MEAGIGIDLETLRLVGVRAVVIAIIGSILPIAIGITIAKFLIGLDTRGAIAAGCSFGPTSAGISMNVLKTSKLLDTPIGQMIVAAAVVDDIIALIVLSQLQALVGDVTVSSVVVPIVSALGYLLFGGYIALHTLPPILQRYVLPRLSPSSSKFNTQQSNSQESHTTTKSDNETIRRNGPLWSLCLMFAMLLAMMPVTHYAQASFLLGAFLTGLTFSSVEDAHVQWASQLKRVSEWLLRMFFAASIAFQVPVREFANGKVLWQACAFLLALVGKLAVGTLVPVLSENGHTTRFRGSHFRDCLIVGFSMTAEAEFAFVTAAFGVQSNLFSSEVYASIVLAVLSSTILSPFALRMVISNYKRRHGNTTREADPEQGADIDLEVVARSAVPINTDLSDWSNERLQQMVIDNKVAFLHIRIKCKPSWNLLLKIAKAISGEVGLEVINHRIQDEGSTPSSIVINDLHVVFPVEGLDNSPKGNGAAQIGLDNFEKKIRFALATQLENCNAIVHIEVWEPETARYISDAKENGSSTCKSRCFQEQPINIRDSLLFESQQSLQNSSITN